MAALPQTTPQLSIIILNYKTDELVVNMVAGLKPQKDMEIIVIDNNEKDTLKQNLPPRKDLIYFFMNKNAGFSGGNNKGIQLSKGEWCLLLNSDVEIEKEAIRLLLDVAQQHKAKVTAPTLLNKDDSVQQSVGYFDSWRSNFINYLFARPRFVETGIIGKPLYVDFATGAVLLIKKSVFDTIGMFDDKNFFMYFEDIDFCMRLKKNHIPILYVPQVTVLHYGGSSANQDMSKKNIHYQQSLRNYMRKHRGRVIEFINNVVPILR